MHRAQPFEAGESVVDAQARPYSRYEQPGADGRPDLDWLAAEFGRRGLTRVLVESGGLLAAALVKAALIDRLAWFRSPKLIGGDGRSAIAAFGIDGIAEAPAFARDSIFDAGDDVLETYHRAT